MSDNAKVKQLRASLHGTFYPRDGLEINWEKNDYAEAYKSYQKVCESNGNKEPILPTPTIVRAWVGLLAASVCMYVCMFVCLYVCLFAL